MTDAVAEPFILEWQKTNASLMRSVRKLAIKPRRNLGALVGGIQNMIYVGNQTEIFI